MGGHAGRRAGTLLGKSAREMFDIRAQFISLVSKGANGESVIAKADLPADAPPWARELAETQRQLRETLAKIEANDVAIAELKAGTLGKSSTSISDVRKAALLESEARRDARAVELRKSHAVLSDQLEHLWSAEGASLFAPNIRRQREAELCLEIDRIERELAALQKSGIDFDGAHSAFKFRGGVSERLAADRIFPAGDSAFELKPERVSKREDGRPIRTMRF